MYKGLKKRKTYDEMINYLLHNQEIINYPNRSENKIKEWIDQKFDDYNLYKEMRLQDEIKQKRINKLLTNQTTQTDPVIDVPERTVDMEDKSTQTKIKTKNRNVGVDWNDQSTTTPSIWYKRSDYKELGPYTGDEVVRYINYRNKFLQPDWENLELQRLPYTKHKATQVLRLPSERPEKLPDDLITYTADVEPIAVPSIITVPDFIARPMNTFVESLIPNPLEIVDIIGKFITSGRPDDDYIYQIPLAHATVETYPEMPPKPTSTASGSGELFTIPTYQPRREEFQFDESAIAKHLKKGVSFFEGLTGVLS